MKRFLLLLTVLLATGCGGGGTAPEANSGAGQPPGQSSNTTSGLRFLHAASDGMYLTFTWYGNWLLVGLSYQEATEYYDPIREVMEIHVHESFSGTTMAIFTETFESGVNYTAVMARPSLDVEMEPIVFTDDLSAPPADQFKIRFLNLAESAGDVDVYLVAEGSTFADTTAITQNVEYKSGNTYYPLPTGKYQIVVAAAGTDTILKQSASFSFAPGTIRTAALFDKRGGGAPFDLKIVTDKN